jgi:hypothetical protein
MGQLLQIADNRNPVQTMIKSFPAGNWFCDLSQQQAFHY